MAGRWHRRGIDCRQSDVAAQCKASSQLRGLMELKKKSIGAGLAIGAGLGVALGVALHNVGVWLPIGVALGLAFSLRGKG